MNNWFRYALYSFLSILVLVAIMGLMTPNPANTYGMNWSYNMNVPGMPMQMSYSGMGTMPMNWMNWANTPMGAMPNASGGMAMMPMQMNYSGMGAMPMNWMNAPMGAMPMNNMAMRNMAVMPGAGVGMPMNWMNNWTNTPMGTMPNANAGMAMMPMQMPMNWMNWTNTPMGAMPMGIIR